MMITILSNIKTKAALLRTYIHPSSSCLLLSIYTVHAMSFTQHRRDDHQYSPLSSCTYIFFVHRNSFSFTLINCIVYEHYIIITIFFFFFNYATTAAGPVHAAYVPEP